ncbi:MAG: ABC transporter permease [Chloroflexi bacterium RBG_13_46_14]|nr:MAG: ABC transporter permease [Chloroflexi bacterium RBG_13_46_14]
MSQDAAFSGNSLGPQVRISETRRFLRVFLSRGLVVAGLVILIIFFITALAGPLFSPYDPVAQNLKDTLASPSGEHLLGTDYLGRDTLSRLIYGARMSLMVGVVALGIAAVVGITVGLLAGFYGKWVNTVIMRIVDALMAFPMILLALLLAGLLGGGLINVMIALGIALIPAYARLMCGQVLSIRENDYILAEKAMGISNLRLMFSHILPNALPSLIVLITMQIGVAILAEAGLSYLGVGISPPTASWGAMVDDGFTYLLTNPLLSFVPGLAIMVVVFAFNMVGDGLRDAFDPRLRGTF